MRSLEKGLITPSGYTIPPQAPIKLARPSPYRSGCTRPSSEARPYIDSITRHVGEIKGALGTPGRYNIPGCMVKKPAVNEVLAARCPLIYG